MIKQDWSMIDEATEGGTRLPAGAYVVRITDVEDVESKEYLNIIYDIAEGEFKDHYSDDFGRKNSWIHRFMRSYKKEAERFFKSFLVALEESNGKKVFDISKWQEKSDPQDFVGLEVGIILQTEKYTNGNGEDKERLNVERVLASQDVRNGDFKMPPVKDTRTGAQASEPAGSKVYDNDPIPF